MPVEKVLQERQYKRTPARKTDEGLHAGKVLEILAGKGRARPPAMTGTFKKLKVPAPLFGAGTFFNGL